MTYNTSPLVLRSGVRPNWLPDERFWYRVTTAEGAEFVSGGSGKGDARAGVRSRETRGRAGRARHGRTIDAKNLPFQELEFTPDGQMCHRAGGRPIPLRCGGDEVYGRGRGGSGRLAGGRGGRGGSRRWRHRDAVAGWQEGGVYPRQQLVGARPGDQSRDAVTTDGVKDFGYATDNAGWTKSDRPVLLWSPDSKRIATFQQDQRGVGEMYLVETKVGHPHAAGVEVSAAGRRSGDDDPAGGARSGRAARGAPQAAAPTSTARRCATT